MGRHFNTSLNHFIMEEKLKELIKKYEKSLEELLVIDTEPMNDYVYGKYVSRIEEFKQIISRLKDVLVHE